MTSAGQRFKCAIIKGQLARIRLHGLDFITVRKIICDEDEMTIYHLLKNKNCVCHHIDFEPSAN